jgi:hypothetical protein
MLNAQSILTKINTQISITLTTCNSTQISGTKQLRNTCTVNIIAAYFSQNKCTNFSHIIILSKKKNSTQDQIGSTHTQQKKKSKQDQIGSTHTQQKLNQHKIRSHQLILRKKKKKSIIPKYILKKKKIRSDPI